MSFRYKNFLKCSEIVKTTNYASIKKHVDVLDPKFKESVYAETAHFPSSIAYLKRIKAIAQNNECKCPNCGTVHGDTFKTYCSKECRLAHTKSAYDAIARKKIVDARERKFANGVDGIDYVTCAICGEKMGDLGTHIQRHGISNSEYKKKFNVKYFKPQTIRESRMGGKNPAYNHGGKYSAWSENFIHGYDKDRHQSNNKRHSLFVTENRDKFKNNIAYWLKECNGDELEAAAKYKKFQTRDMAWFVEKYGPEEGPVRHAAKTEKWVKNFKKQNYSMISQELFKQLSERMPEGMRETVYFATHEREDMACYKNKEYILDVGTTHIRPDFVCLDTKKIIEFDGDYWHSEKADANYIEREQKRDDKIVQVGYTVMHVKECDFRKNPESVITECLNYLTQ